MPTEYVAAITTGNVRRPIKDAEARTLFSASWLKDKNIVMYGDSTLVVPENYANILRNSGIPASVTVRAVSGNTLTTQGLPIIQAASDLSNFDYVFICYGINDWSGIVRNTWKNAVRSAATAVLTAGSEPVFVFPWLVYIPTTASGGWINNKGCTMDAFIDAAIAVCEEMSLKYFNLYNMANVNKQNYTTRLTASSNGYFLHEGQDLAEDIAKIILSGQFNTGMNLAGKYRQPSKAILPTDYGFETLQVVSGLIGSTPQEFRKGRITSIKATVCTFLAMSTGKRVKISGYYTNSSNGYMTLSAKNIYNNQTALITRIDAGSDFEFIFEPPQNGGCWALVGESSADTTGIIFDFTIAAENGTVRMCGSDPSDPMLEMIYDSDFTVHDACNLIILDSGAVQMGGFTGVLGTSHPAGVWSPVGAFPFYPQRVMYGFCMVDGEPGYGGIYRITQSGTVRLVLDRTYTAGTLIRFSGMDVTPSEYLYPNIDT